jgi:hypothetical protein
MGGRLRLRMDLGRRNRRGRMGMGAVSLVGPLRLGLVVGSADVSDLPCALLARRRGWPGRRDGLGTGRLGRHDRQHVSTLGASGERVADFGGLQRVDGKFVGHISGEQGSIARVGDDVYAGHDGNVYQRTDDGWQQMPERDRPSTERPSTMPGQTQQQLDRDMSARSHGAERYAGRQQSVRAMSRGGGRRR